MYQRQYHTQKKKIYYDILELRINHLWGLWTKFLCAIIDKILTSKDHILHLSNKISRAIRIIFEFSKNDWITMVCLHSPFIYPYMTYCNHADSSYSTCMSSLNKIVVFRQGAIKITCNINQSTSPDVLCRNISFLSVNAYLITRLTKEWVSTSLKNWFITNNTNTIVVKVKTNKQTINKTNNNETCYHW